MDQDCHRRDRQCALRLMQAIGPPVRLDDGLGDGATGLLVKKRHPVRKTQEANALVLLRDKVFSSALFMRFRLMHMTARVDFNIGLAGAAIGDARSEEHTSELQSPCNL